MPPAWARTRGDAAASARKSSTRPGSTRPSLRCIAAAMPIAPAARAKPPTIVQRAQSGNGRNAAAAAPTARNASASSRCAQTRLPVARGSPGQLRPAETRSTPTLEASPRRAGSTVSRNEPTALAAYTALNSTAPWSVARQAIARSGCASATTTNAVARSGQLGCAAWCRAPPLTWNETATKPPIVAAAIAPGSARRLIEVQIGVRGGPPQSGRLAERERPSKDCGEYLRGDPDRRRDVAPRVAIAAVVPAQPAGGSAKLGPGPSRRRRGRPERPRQSIAHRTRGPSRARSRRPYCVPSGGSRARGESAPRPHRQTSVPGRRLRCRSSPARPPSPSPSRRTSPGGRATRRRAPSAPAARPGAGRGSSR